MTPTLKARLGEVVAVFCAVLVGATLITASAVVAETGLRSRLPANGLARADLVVSGDQRVVQDEDFDVSLPDRVPVAAGLTGRLRTVPGVADAASDVSFPAALAPAGQMPGASGRALHQGHAWMPNLLSPHDFRGRAPSAPNDVALSESVAHDLGVGLGSRLDTVLAGRRTPLTVTAVVTAPGADVRVAPALAQQLGRPGSVDLIALRAEPGTDLDEVAARVRHLVGHDAVVTTGDRIGDVEDPAAAAGRSELVLLAMSLGGVVVMLVAFLVAGAVSISVTNRARELALLRAVGATPRQVRSAVAHQTVRISLAAMGIGVAAGYALAVPLLGLFSDSGLVPASLAAAWSPLPAVTAALLLLGTTQIAARAAAFGISRRPATEAVRDTQTEPSTGGRWRTYIGAGLLLVAGGSALSPLITRSEAAVISAASGTLVAIIGLSLLAPALVRAVGTRLRHRLRPGAPPSRWLAVSNSAAYAVRTGGALSVLTLAIALTVTQLFTSPTLSAAAHADTTAADRGAVTLVAPGLGGVDASTVAAARTAPGVRAVVPLRSSTVAWPSVEDGKRTAEPLAMTALGHGADTVLDLDVSHGSLADLKGDAVAVESTTARFRGVSVGDRIPLVLPDGARVHPRVVATYGRGFGFGKVVVSTDLLRGPQMYDSALVAGSGSPTELAAGVRRAVANHAGTQVIPDSVVAASTSEEDESRTVSLVITLVLMGYVLLGLANRLVATTARRRIELQTLRAVGATPAQLRSTLRHEALLVGAGATVVGLTISLVPMTALGAGLVREPWPQGPLWAAGLVCVVVAGSAYAAVMTPARRMVRTLGTS